MITKLNLEQRSEAWFAARAGKRTASEYAIVQGISPFTTIAKFQLIKAGLAKQYFSAAMQLGTNSEDKIRAWAERHFNTKFDDPVFIHGDYLASLDGYCPDLNILVEFKTSAKTYAELKEGYVAPYYEAQLLQQLYCSGATHGYLIAWCPKTDAFAISDAIYSDPNFKAKADAAWDAFNALPLPEGPVDASDNQQLERAFRKYAQVKSRIELLETELEEARQEILEFKAPDRNVQCRGFEIGFRKGSRTTNYKQACADAKLDLSGYEKVGEPSWTLKLAAPEFEVDEDS